MLFNKINFYGIRKLFSPFVLLWYCGIMVFYGCANYSDQKIHVKSQEFIDVFSPSFKLAITGKEQIDYVVKISIDEQNVDTFLLKSNSEKSYQEVSFNFSALKESLPSFSYNLLLNPQIKLHIMASNASNNIQIDTTILFNVKIPPITISAVEGDNFSKTIHPKLSSKENEIKNQIGDFKEQDVKRAAILADMLESQKHFTTAEIDEISLPILSSYDIVKVKILADTVYKHSIITCYPSDRSKFYSKINLDSSIQNSMLNKLESIKSSWKGKMQGEKYILEEDILPTYEGLVSLYLINFDNNGSYTYTQLGDFFVDKKAPVFYNLPSYSDFGDYRYEGIVYLRNENFYGFSPYKVPFIGMVYGDVKELYVANKRVEFEIGVELYFKQSLFLDGGYNRVPIKIIDFKGNISEYFITINIESMSKNEINIENDINLNE